MSVCQRYKAAVTMFRRVVEAVACDKLEDRSKDPKGKTLRLHNLIDTLHTEGLITKDIKDNAHELRHLGNYGAHVQDDRLDDVTEEDVASVREIAWQLLYSIYVAPYKAVKLREARTSRHKSAE